MGRFFLLLFFLAGSAMAQCGVMVVNPTTGRLDCIGTGGSGGGTVTSVVIQGTANQVAVQSGSNCTVTTTGTCVISLPSNLILPNGATATTQTVGDNTAKVATDAFVLANAASIGGTFTAGAIVVATSTKAVGTPCIGCTLDSTGTELMPIAGSISFGGALAVAGTQIQLKTADADLTGITNYYTPTFSTYNGSTLGFGNGIAVINTTYAAGDGAQGMQLYQMADGTGEIDIGADSSTPINLVFHPADGSMNLVGLGGFTIGGGASTSAVTINGAPADSSFKIFPGGTLSELPWAQYHLTKDLGATTFNDIAMDLETHADSTTHYGTSGILLHARNGANTIIGGIGYGMEYTLDGTNTTATSCGNFMFDFYSNDTVYYYNPCTGLPPDFEFQKDVFIFGKKGFSDVGFYGGRNNNSALHLVSTEGTGATDSITFGVGTNGGTLAGTVNHNGTWIFPIAQGFTTGNLTGGYSSTPVSGSVVSNPQYFKFAAKIIGWSATSADAGSVTCQFDVWKKSAAYPAIGDSILTGGFLGLSASSTPVLNQGVGLFTTTTINAGDIISIADHGGSAANSCQVQVHYQVSGS